MIALPRAAPSNVCAAARWRGAARVEAQGTAVVVGVSARWYAAPSAPVAGSGTHRESPERTRPLAQLEPYWNLDQRGEELPDKPKGPRLRAVREIVGAGFGHLSPTLACRFVEVIQLRP